MAHYKDVAVRKTSINLVTGFFQYLRGKWDSLTNAGALQLSPPALTTHHSVHLKLYIRCIPVCVCVSVLSALVHASAGIPFNLRDGGSACGLLMPLLAVWCLHCPLDHVTAAHVSEGDT